MELKCDNCGVIDCVLVDGYAIGDRLLEEVYFKIEDKDGKPHSIGVIDECKDYFDGFNRDKWLLAMEAHCQDLDYAECPKCGSEVDVSSWERGNRKPIKVVKKQLKF